MLSACALALHAVEGLFPPLPIAGARVGIANIPAVFALYAASPNMALCVTLVRVALSASISGSVTGFILSLTGGMLSLMAMVAVKKLAGGRFSIVGVSVIGALMHNTGQIAAAAFITQSASIAYYLPVLLVVAMPTGIFVGLAARALLRAQTELKTKRR